MIMGLINQIARWQAREILARPETPPVHGLVRIRLINDDKTPMEFVVRTLEKVFEIPRKEAVETMLRVHYNGSDVLGPYSHEAAKSKAAALNERARQHGHPLQCTMEKE